MMSIVKVRRKRLSKKFRRSWGVRKALDRGPRGVSEIEIGGDELIGALSGLGLRYHCCAIELGKVSMERKPAVML